MSDRDDEHRLEVELDMPVWVVVLVFVLLAVGLVFGTFK